MKLSYDECDFINTFDGNGLISYIYAVLYSNKYRNKYREFIKKDYPRIPITSNKELFKKLSVLGRQLIKLHLMKEHKHNNDIRFYGEYNFTLDKPFYQDRKIVMCKAGYYFDNIDKWLWEYYIGGYQPLQKWAKDHKGLRMDETMIFHYMEIINIIIETEKIVHQIDEIIIL